RIGNDCLTDRDLPLPRASRLQLRYRTEYGRFLAALQSGDRAFRTGCVIPDREMIKKITQRNNAELFERGKLPRRQAERVCERICRRHAGIIGARGETSYPHHRGEVIHICGETYLVAPPAR